MKQGVIFLLTALLSNALFAQEKSDILIITRDSLTWKSPKIVSSADTVCIGFGKQDVITLKTSCKELMRTDLTTLLEADKKIFHQPNDLNNSKIIDSENAGILVNNNNKNDYPGAYVEFRKNDLPVTLTFDQRKILVLGFDPKKDSLCKFINKQEKLYTEPYIKIGNDNTSSNVKYTVSKRDLNNFVFQPLKIEDENNSEWKIKCDYYVEVKIDTTDSDGNSVSKRIQEIINGKLEDGNSGSVRVKYIVTCNNDYFEYESSGLIAELVIDNNIIGKYSKIIRKYSKEIIVLVSLILIVLVIIYSLPRLKKIFYQNNQRKKSNIQQEYIDELAKRKGSDDKLNIIRKLLSNEDMEFRAVVARILDPILDSREFEERIHCLEKIIETRNEEINSLKSTKDRLKQDLESSSSELCRLQKDIECFQRSSDELKETVNQLKKDNDVFQGRIDAYEEIINNLQNDNHELKECIGLHEETVKRLRLEINESKFRITQKDCQIEQLSSKNQALKEQLTRISRQNMFVNQIDDALKDVSESIIKAFPSVPEGELNKKLVVPLLNGVPGLDEGMTAYYSRWQKIVLSKQHDFFGKDLYDMSDDEVKKKLVSGFLKTIAQGDTFSKLTRLFMYIQADWINSILIENGFNVDEVERVFNRLKLLFYDFGIEIVYPRLFVDHMNEQKYSFDPRCEVFKLFPISEELRASISQQHDLIIDIIQIGIDIPLEQYSRKAIVSIPSF